MDKIPPFFFFFSKISRQPKNISWLVETGNAGRFDLPQEVRKSLFKERR